MLAASIESFFIFLLIAGGSALFNWYQKRKENAESTSESWGEELPPATRREPTFERTSVPPLPRPEKKATNWEEELRRMLEGTVPSTRNPVPPPIMKERRLPPVPRQNEPIPATPTTAIPKTFREKFHKAHCNHCGEHIEFPASATEEVVSCPHCHQATVLRPFQDTRVETLSHEKELSSFNFSTKKYEAASEMSERVAAHMHSVGHVPVGLTSIESTKKIWPEVAETKALFQNAKTVRQAMIASLIFGPPKALEN